MKKVSLILWKKLNGLFGQPNMPFNSINVYSAITIFLIVLLCISYSNGEVLTPIKLQISWKKDINPLNKYRTTENDEVLK